MKASAHPEHRPATSVFNPIHPMKQGWEYAKNAGAAAWIATDTTFIAVPVGVVGFTVGMVKGYGDNVVNRYHDVFEHLRK